MVQRSNLKSKKSKSVGSSKKKVGVTAKHKHHSSQGRNLIRDKATATYVNTIEAQMASRLPSDQRDKLSVIKNTNGAPQPKKSKKKPLTRGRTRKDHKKK